MGETGADAATQVPRYQATLDRTGLALAAGGAVYGVLAAALVVRGGAAEILTLMEVLVAGSALAMLAITATFAPLWLVLHASGRRAPGHAAALGAIVALALWGAAAHDVLASYAFADSASAAIGWLRGAGVALMFAATGAAVALVMWRIAYRRRG